MLEPQVSINSLEASSARHPAPLSVDPNPSPKSKASRDHAHSPAHNNHENGPRPTALPPDAPRQAPSACTHCSRRLGAAACLACALRCVPRALTSRSAQVAGARLAAVNAGLQLYLHRASAPNPAPGAPRARDALCRRCGFPRPGSALADSDLTRAGSGIHAAPATGPSLLRPRLPEPGKEILVTQDLCCL